MLEPIVSRKKKHVKKLVFLSLSNASDVSLAFYSEKSRANLKIVKISQQMLKFQKRIKHSKYFPHQFQVILTHYLAK